MFSMVINAENRSIQCIQPISSFFDINQEPEPIPNAIPYNFHLSKKPSDEYFGKYETAFFFL